MRKILWAVVAALAATAVLAQTPPPASFVTANMFQVATAGPYGLGGAQPYGLAVGDFNKDGKLDTIAAGWSSSAPAPASSIRIRSVIGAGIPWSRAAAMTCARSRLPSSSPITTAARPMPVSATARRGSMPICTVSRSRQTASKPDFRVGLTARSVSRLADIPAG